MKPEDDFAKRLIPPLTTVKQPLEWIDLVPGYRILGFGSDVRFLEMIYDHLKMARSCVAYVLVSKIKQSLLSKERALC